MWIAYVYEKSGSSEQQQGGPFVVTDINLTWRLGERCSGSVTILDHQGWFENEYNVQSLFRYRYYIKLYYNNVAYISMHVNSYSKDEKTKEVTFDVVDVSAELDYYMMRILSDGQYIYDFSVTVTNNTPPGEGETYWVDFLNIFTNSTGGRWNFQGWYPYPPSGWDEYGFPVYQSFEFQSKYLTVQNAVRKFSEMFNCNCIIDPLNWTVRLNETLSTNLGTLNYLDVKISGKRVFETVGDNIKAGVLVGNSINDVSIYEFSGFNYDPIIYERNIHAKSIDEASKALAHRLYDYFNIKEAKNRPFYYDVEIKVLPVYYGSVTQYPKPGLLVEYNETEYRIEQLNINLEGWTLKLVENVKSKTESTFQNVREEVLKDFFREKAEEEEEEYFFVPCLRTPIPSCVETDPGYPYSSMQLCSLNSIENSANTVFVSSNWFVWSLSSYMYGGGFSFRSGQKRNGEIIYIKKVWGEGGEGFCFFKFLNGYFDCISYIDGYNLSFRLIWDFDLNGDDELFLYDDSSSILYVYNLDGELIESYSFGFLPLGPGGYNLGVNIGDFDDDNKLEIFCFLQSWWIEDDDVIYLFVLKQLQEGVYTFYDYLEYEPPGVTNFYYFYEFLLHKVRSDDLAGGFVINYARSDIESVDIILWNGDFYIQSFVGLPMFYQSACYPKNGILFLCTDYDLYYLYDVRWYFGAFEIDYIYQFTSTSGVWFMSLAGHYVFAGDKKIDLATRDINISSIWEEFYSIVTYKDNYLRFGSNSCNIDDKPYAMWFINGEIDTSFVIFIVESGNLFLIDANMNVFVMSERVFQLHNNIWCVDHENPFYIDLRIRDFARPFNYSESFEHEIYINPNTTITFEPLTLKARSRLFLMVGFKVYLYVLQAGIMIPVGSLPNSDTYPICCDVDSDGYDEILLYDPTYNALKLFKPYGYLVSQYILPETPDIKLLSYANNTTFWFTYRENLTSTWYVCCLVYINGTLSLTYSNYRNISASMCSNPIFAHTLHEYICRMYFTYDDPPTYIRWSESQWGGYLQLAERPVYFLVSVFPWLLNPWNHTILISADPLTGDLYVFFNYDMDSYTTFELGTISDIDLARYACINYTKTDEYTDVLIPGLGAVLDTQDVVPLGDFKLIKPIRMVPGWYYPVQDYLVPLHGGPVYGWSFTLQEDERLLPIDLSGDTYISFIKYSPYDCHLYVPTELEVFIPFEIVNTRNYIVPRPWFGTDIQSDKVAHEGCFGFHEWKDIILKLPITITFYYVTDDKLVSSLVWVDGRPKFMTTSRIIDLYSGDIEIKPSAQRYHQVIKVAGITKYYTVGDEHSIYFYRFDHSLAFSYTFPDNFEVVSGLFEVPTVEHDDSYFCIFLYDWNRKSNYVYIIRSDNGNFIDYVYTAINFTPFRKDIKAVVFDIDNDGKLEYLGHGVFYNTNTRVCTIFDTDTRSFSYFYVGNINVLFSSPVAFDHIRKYLFCSHKVNSEADLACVDFVNRKLVWSKTFPIGLTLREWNYDGQYLYALIRPISGNTFYLYKLLNGQIISYITFEVPNRYILPGLLICKLFDGESLYDAILVFVVNREASMLDLLVYDTDLNLKFAYPNLIECISFQNAWTFFPANEKQFIAYHFGDIATEVFILSGS